MNKETYPEVRVGDTSDRKRHRSIGGALHGWCRVDWGWCHGACGGGAAHWHCTSALPSVPLQLLQSRCLTQPKVT